PLHVPPRQVSTSVQAFPSLQLVPSGKTACWQPPAGSHESSVQGLLSSQSGGAPPRHTPWTHVSVSVQADPSSQGVPSGREGLEQLPVRGSHVPGPWQPSGATHWTGSAPAHAPAWHVSVRVQASPSSQSVPSRFGARSHCSVASLQTPPLH